MPSARNVENISSPTNSLDPIPKECCSQQDVFNDVDTSEEDVEEEEVLDFWVEFDGTPRDWR